MKKNLVAGFSRFTSGFVIFFHTRLPKSFSLNLILLVFNLIPLPPLDGSNVLLFFLSERNAERYESFLYQPMYRMIGLVVAWQLFTPVFDPIHTLALNILYPGAGYH